MPILYQVIVSGDTAMYKKGKIIPELSGAYILMIVWALMKLVGAIKSLKDQ